MHAALAIVAAVVLLVVIGKGFFGSFWRAPPKREETAATDWSSYVRADEHHGSSDPPGHA